jgi:Domain of unknown function (DUF1772)
MPSLKRITSPLERVGFWSSNYDYASKIMASLGTIGAIAFGTAAYYAPTIGLRNSMIASGVLAFSAFPFTILAIFPTVQALKRIDKRKDVAVADAEGDGLLAKWSNLNYIRFGLVAIGSLNGLKELSEWYVL